jgi:hypothetical protein
MGGLKGFIPSRFINDLEAAEAALKGFIKNPDSASLGPEWNTEEIAEDLHVGS